MWNIFCNLLGLGGYHGIEYACCWKKSPQTLMSIDNFGETVTYYVSRQFHLRVSGEETRIQKYYPFGGQPIAVRTQANGTDTLTWLLTDHLGSAQVTAAEGGAASGVQRYSAFGEVRSRGGEMPTAYQYTGQLSQMEEVGLYHYGARWFDPAGAHFTQADTLIPGVGNPLSWDRYGYVKNNPINYTDPTGHREACEENCNEQRRLDRLYDTLGAVEYFQHEIKSQFGIEMIDRGMNWAKNNLMTAYHALYLVNLKLNGNLKSMLGGTSFELSGGGNEYYGWTHPTKVEFHVSNGNYKIPLTNFLHEIGHLLDFVPATADVFSGPLKDTTPNWVDSNGYVDANLLLGKLYQPVQAKYIPGEDFDENEYWADAFANYVASNIDLSNPAGKNMHDYVTGALSPYANP